MKSFKSIFRISLMVIPIFLVLVFRVEAGSALGDARFFATGLLNRTFSYKEFREIEAENLRLRFELSQIKGDFVLEEIFVEKKFDSLEAKVYSRYPWNGRGRVVINKGTSHGVEEGMVVITKTGALFGEVGSVRNHQSEVISIFDPSWRSSVSLGESETKALLRGGQFPKLEFIPTDSEAKEGDFIKNISPDFPFGLLIGKVRSLAEDEFEPWLSADIDTVWRINELRNLMILVDFP